MRMKLLVILFVFEFLALALVGCGGVDQSQMGVLDGTEAIADTYVPQSIQFTDTAQVTMIGSINWTYAIDNIVRVYDPDTCVVLYIIGGELTAPVQTTCMLGGE